MTTEADVYSPQRIRGFAALVYRLAAGNVHVREVGDFLARCAAAADEHGDLLQQRDALRAELARLHQATAEADAQRIRADRLQSELSAAAKAASVARTLARREVAQRAELEAEVRGNRLWLELAGLLLAEAQPLLPADKAALIDPLRAAKVARSDRAALSEAMRLLRSVREYLSLAAQNDGNGRARALVAAIDATTGDAPCQTS